MRTAVRLSICAGQRSKVGIEKTGSGARMFGGAIHIREERPPMRGRCPYRLRGHRMRPEGDAWLIPTRARRRAPAVSVSDPARLDHGGLSLASRRRRAVDAFVERRAVDSKGAHPSGHAPRISNVCSDRGSVGSRHERASRRPGLSRRDAAAARPLRAARHRHPRVLNGPR